MTQFVPGGQLFDYLRKQDKLQKQNAVLLSAMVATMFQYLHQKNIIYRDLKPQNLLIDKNGYLKLTDFGFSKIINDRTYTLCGTPQYLAPQILLNQGHGKPVDWWTLGVLIYQLHAGIDPFADGDPLMIYQNILKLRIKFPKNFHKDAKSIIKHLLVLELSKRYGNMRQSPQEIKKHRYFQNVNWNQLFQKNIQMKYKPNLFNLNPLQYYQKYQGKLNTQDGAQLNKQDDPFYDQI